MLSNGNSGCGYSDEIVSYIYGELGSTEMRQFETHLGSCSECTDEFAAISNARFSVFEWHKEEFAHLATPEIVIPYADKRTEVAPVKVSGILAGLYELIASVRSPVMVAAGLFLLVGLGIITLTFIRSGNEGLIASNQEVPPVSERSTQIPSIDASPGGSLTEPETGKPEIDTLPNKVTPVVAAKVGQETRPTRAVSSSMRRSNVNTGIRNSSQARKAPVLSEFNDDEDDSLRLSDLFDEIGG